MVRKGDRLYIRKDDDAVSNIVTYKGQDSLVLTGSVKEPIIGMLQTNRKPGFGIKIFLENTYYSITINAEDGDNDFYTPFKTNSTCHNIWYGFYDNLGKINITKRALTNLYTDYISKRDTQKADSLINLIKKLEQEEKNAYIELGEKHPDNVATAYIFTGIMEFRKKHADLFKTFSPEVKNSKWGKILNGIVEKLENDNKNFSQEKDILLDNNLRPLQGVLANSNEQLTIDTDYIKKTGKKITIIDFWASWCSPCRQVNKEFIPFYIEHKEKGLGVISFGLDSDKTPWLEAIVKDKLPWINISDILGMRSPIAKKYNLDHIPSNVIVNEEGKIIGIDIFDKEKIKELLKK